MTKPRLLALSIGASGVVCALLAWRLTGPARALLAWTALACALAAAAYVWNRPEVLAKRDGRLRWGRALPLLPYLLAYQVGCRVRGWRRRSAAWNEVAPGLYVGARVEAWQLPAGVDLVVDLTSEWSAPHSLLGLAGYRSLPVLDGSHPRDPDLVLELLAEIVTSGSSVYVHCESGKGRAPTLAALVLVARGSVDGPTAAIEQVAKQRPATRLTVTDVAFVHAMSERLLARAG
jgi:protein-tyrosine phosphatase